MRIGLDFSLASQWTCKETLNESLKGLILSLAERMCTSRPVSSDQNPHKHRWQRASEASSVQFKLET